MKLDVKGLQAQEDVQWQLWALNIDIATSQDLRAFSLLFAGFSMVKLLEILPINCNDLGAAQRKPFEEVTLKAKL